MDSFASAAFLNLPNPILVISEHLLVRTANRAAEKFFGCSSWTEELSGLAGDNNNSAQDGYPLLDLGIQLENDSDGWNDILVRARQHENDYERVTEAALVDLPPGEEYAFRLSRPKGSIVASFSVSSWEHTGETFFTLTFFRRRRHEHAPVDFTNKNTPVIGPDEALDSPEVLFDSRKAKELAHLKTALFECGPRIGMLLSVNSETCYLNKACSELLHGTKFCSLDWFQERYSLWDPDFTQPVQLDDMPLVAAGRKGVDVPERHYGFTRPDGIRITIALEGRCLLDPLNNRLIGSVCFGRSLGECESVKAQRLDETLKSFETIVDTLPHFVWTAHRDGSRDWFSKQWLQYTGLSLDQCVEDGWMTAMHPEDSKRWEQHRQEALEAGEKYEAEVRVRRHDGAYRWTLKRGYGRSTAGLIPS